MSNGDGQGQEACGGQGGFSGKTIKGMAPKSVRWGCGEGQGGGRIRPGRGGTHNIVVDVWRKKKEKNERLTRGGGLALGQKKKSRRGGHGFSHGKKKGTVSQSVPTHWLQDGAEKAESPHPGKKGDKARLLRGRKQQP